ncbi:substrate-binding domain-containing protein [Vibrio sp. ZSDE26]|uniref:Substrate-binding domain-containing protein n=1 Tax=Vibrio amylolyticus TaxID=2847292 RepID=A0A9X2BJD9_9VIBR|nr:substrate-binding domain-containing protein [Vibrio amylolyticus]MCK6265714.1 substrate-binding domain-containing protein [Vibrio amylolyticus]
MGIKKATLNDIALTASVSVSTLSRYLHRRGYVSRDKQVRIQAAMSKLNYHPRVKGHKTQSGLSHLVGVIIPYALCPHSNAILSGLEEKLAEFNLIPLVTIGKWSNETELARFRVLMKQGVDGVVVIGGSLTHLQLVDLALDLPLVTIGNYDVESEKITSINTNNYVGGYLATNHLLQLGHTKIAHISGISFHPDAKQRMKGYQEAIKKAGLPLSSDLIVTGNFEVKSGDRAVERLLDQRIEFSAIFAANDQMAFGAISALKRAGIQVPEQVSVVGFDDHEISGTYTPPLTTLAQPSQYYGALAAEKIAESLGLCSLKERSLWGEECLSVIIRESCMYKDSICAEP